MGTIKWVLRLIGVVFGLYSGHALWERHYWGINWNQVLFSLLVSGLTYSVGYLPLDEKYNLKYILMSWFIMMVTSYIVGWLGSTGGWFFQSIAGVGIYFIFTSIGKPTDR